MPILAPLGLQAAIAFGVAHSATLAARRAAVVSAESALVQARAAELPLVSGSLQNTLSKSANAQGSFAQFGLTQSSNFSQNTAEISSTYALYNGSGNQIAAVKAERALASARADFDRARAQFETDVTASYYDLAAKGESVAAAAHDLAYRRQLVAVARANERNGLVAGVDVLRAQVDEIRSESASVAAAAAEANASESLAAQIGAPLETPFVLPKRIAEPPPPAEPVAALVERAESERPDIASARAAADEAILANRAIDAPYLPQVALNGAFGNQFSPTSYVQSIPQLIAAGLPVPPRGSPGFWQFGVTSSWTLPLVDFGVRHAAHHAARAEIDSAELALAAARASVELDVRTSARAVDTASQNLAFAKENVTLASDSARIAALQYKSGLISFTDASAVEQTDLDAQNTLISARVTYVDALVRLRLALGDDHPAAFLANEGS